MIRLEKKMKKVYTSTAVCNSSGIICISYFFTCWRLQCFKRCALIYLFVMGTRYSGWMSVLGFWTKFDDMIFNSFSAYILVLSRAGHLTTKYLMPVHRGRCKIEAIRFHISKKKIECISFLLNNIPTRQGEGRGFVPVWGTVCSIPPQESFELISLSRVGLQAFEMMGKYQWHMLYI